MNKHFCPYCMSPVREGDVCTNCGLTSGSYVPSLHHLPPGTVLLDRYLVGRVLGEGGFGITYIGCDLRLELKVAIKEYYPVDRSTRNASVSLGVTSFMGPSAQSYQRGKEKFLGEARAMAKMDKQQAIVSVRDYFEANNTAYIVMEYIEGTTFSDLVRQRGGRIPPDELFGMIEPLFGALAIMHGNGLIHRDISPDNLMLEHGKVRLLDFGCARETSHGIETLTIALKQGYAPVEQYQSKGQGPWTDIYALCATIYFCLTGKAPPQALDRIAGDSLLPPSKLGVDIPPYREEALLKGLTIQPNRRYRSMEELRSALYRPAPAHESEEKTAGVDSPCVPEPPAEDIAPETEAPAETAASAAGEEPAVETAELPGPPEEPSAPAQEPDAPARRGKLIFWASAGAAALLLAVLLIVLLPRSSQEPPAMDTGYVPPSPAWQELFSGAAELAAADGEAALLELMERADVTAVVMREGCYIRLESAPPEITKPLLIEEGAGLEFSMPLSVGGSGHIRVEGTLCLDGGTLLADGSVYVASTGELVGSGLALLKHEDCLTVDGGLASLSGVEYGGEGSAEHFITLDEDALFADATHVTTFDEYMTAAKSGLTRAIVIDGDFALGGERHDTDHSVPVLISEGVTVTVPYDEDFTWLVDATVLINRGTISGGLQTGDFNGDSYDDPCAILNYGTIEGRLHLECRGAMINMGDISVWGAQFIGTDLYNFGTLSLPGNAEENFIDIMCGTACNYGSIVVSGTAADGVEPTLNLVGDSGFMNIGVIDVKSHGILSNGTHLINRGSILFSEANSLLENLGYLETVSSGASLEMDPESRLVNEGVIQTWDGSAVLPARRNIEEAGGFVTEFRPEADGVFRVSTEEELRLALEDGACTQIVIGTENGLSVNGDLTIGKNVLVTHGALMLSGGSLRLEGENARLLGPVDLGGGSLTLNGGALLISNSITSCGGLYIENASRFINFELLSVQSGAPVTLAENSYFISLSHTSFEYSSVSIGEGCILRSSGSMELPGCTVDIEGGELLLNAIGSRFDANTVIVNNGGISLYSVHDMQSFSLEGALTNHGWLEIYTPVNLSGRLHNYGTMQVANTMSVSGMLDNSGTLAAVNCEILTEEGGKMTGTPPQYTDYYIDVRNA